MSLAEEILDAIEIIINKKMRDYTTQIYQGVCVSVNTGNCVVSVNGKNNAVQYYGEAPVPGVVYRVFVPNGNMSTAFIIVPGDSGQPVETGDYNRLINLPSINNIVLKGNKTTDEFGIISDKTYVYNQSNSLTVWNISHNLNKYPSVIVKDKNGSIMIGEINYVNENNITITFSTAVSGTAYLN